MEKNQDYLDHESEWVRTWENDLSLREEFSGNKAGWLAYCRAMENGQVKIFKGNVQTREVAS
jgi:hypothetical protein